jgi:hypothetical protein
MEQPKESKDFEFDPDKHRWPVRDLWGDAELLTDSPPVRSRIPLKQAQDVAGLIGTDVGWRDFKLVRQSRSLGVLCPKPPNRKRLSRGVEAEMRAAIEGADTNIYVWQKRDWDPEKVLASVIGTPGSMGTDPLQQRTKIVDTMEELVDRMLSA